LNSISKKGVVIGENLAAGYESWLQVIKLWTSENKTFSYKSITPSLDNIKTGHYTQVNIIIIIYYYYFFF
jgi:hypothetical protein